MRDRSDRASEARATLGKLRGLVARGATFRQAAARLRKPRTTLQDLAGRHALARGGRRPFGYAALSGDKLKRMDRLLDQGQSLRTIAAIVGCGKSSVGRRRRTRIDRAAGAGLKTVKPWRCPGCGAKLNVEKCLRCQLDRQPPARPTGHAPAAG